MKKFLLILFILLIIIFNLKKVCLKENSDTDPSMILTENKLNLFDDLNKDINNGKFGKIDGIIIYKDDNIILERYFHSYNADKLHNIASCTKSIVSVLLGIAIKEGFISGIEDNIIDFYPEYSDCFSEDKKQLKIKHLLSMTDGADWDELSVNYLQFTKNDASMMYLNKNPIKYYLKKDLQYKPGVKFNYCSGATQIITDIIEKKSGMRLDRFAEKYLFSELQIKKTSWQHFPFNNERIIAYGDLKLLPMDMVKIGRLILNNGRWDNKRIITKEWADMLTNNYENFNNKNGYGYHWWLNSFEDKKTGRFYDAVIAKGWGGQRIYIFKTINLVIIITGSNYNKIDPTQYYPVIESYILPVISDR